MAEVVPCEFQSLATGGPTASALKLLPLLREAQANLLNDKSPEPPIERERPSEQPTPRKQGRGFPGGSVVKNPPADAGDIASSPGPGGSHMPWSHGAHAPQRGLEPGNHNS